MSSIPPTPPDAFVRSPALPVAGSDTDTHLVPALDLAALDYEIFGSLPAVGAAAKDNVLESDEVDMENWHWRGWASTTKIAQHKITLARSPSASPELSDSDDDKDVVPSLLLSTPPSSCGYGDTPALSPTSSASDLVGLDSTAALDSAQSADVQVKCMVRTRIPTPHGEIFLHLYHNTRDGKEHLAVVVDPAQLDAAAPTLPPIRSKSLDAVWSADETEMERVVRGAYVGRLSEEGYTASSPAAASVAALEAAHVDAPPPMVRIHSECFTGETIGSLRCDCGEQLDEALRRIAEPVAVTLTSSAGTTSTKTVPGRGAVIYMRQEGRGIGLLSKLRAYNLQDLGHDTVTANLMLGHGADERGYEVAAAIMRDLGLAGEAGGVRLLTNNPDKVRALTQAGVHIAERVPMVPRTWRCQGEDAHLKTHDHDYIKSPVNLGEEAEERAARLRAAGATLLGAGAARGPELERYLRTKVQRMGHMLSLPPLEVPTIAV